MFAGRRLLLLWLVLLALPAAAIEYRSVDVPAAILYDTPSQKGSKLYLVKQYTPLEVVVRLEGWIKVRDAEGTLAWIEAKLVSDKRMVVVTATRADVHREASPESPLAFEAEKWVALELIEQGPPGWVKVKHRDGALGYVKQTLIWGL